MRVLFFIFIFISNICFSQTHIAEFHGPQFNHTNKGFGSIYKLKKNLKDGKWLFYDYSETDSTLRLEINIFKGKKHGLCQEFYGSGDYRYTKFFNQGKPDSIWHIYSNNGNLAITKTYSEGKLNGEQIRYYKAGGPGSSYESCMYVNGKLEGMCKFCSGSGFVFEETEWKNGHRQGVYKKYHSNGELSLSGHYYPFKRYKYLITDQNQAGTWQYWNENGELEKTEIYKRGKLIFLEENISTNNYPSPDTTFLIVKNCLGKYCLGNNITLDGKSILGYSRRGADTLYYMYHGDSLDHISLTPNEKDPEIIHKMITFSVRFKTKTGIGIGTTIKEILESGEIFSVQKRPNSNGLYLFFPEYGMKAQIDQNTVSLFIHSKKSYDLKNFRLDGFITYLEMEE